MALSKTTQDHDEIKAWAEKRGGRPADVESTETAGEAGIIRLEFPDAPNANDANLKEIDWEPFFEKFDKSGLAMVYQEVTSEGAESNFYKFVHPENLSDSAKKSAGLKTAKKSAPAKKSAAKKATPAKKSASVKASAPVKKSTAATKITAAKKTVAKTTGRNVAKKAASTKTTASKPAATKTAVRKPVAAAKKTTAKPAVKTTVKKAASTKTSSPVKKTATVKKAAAKKTAGKKK